MDIKPENTKLAICNQEVNENSALFEILLAPVFNQGVFNCYKHTKNCQFRISILGFSLKAVKLYNYSSAAILFSLECSK